MVRTGWPKLSKRNTAPLAPEATQTEFSPYAIPVGVPPTAFAGEAFPLAASMPANVLSEALITQTAPPPIATPIGWLPTATSEVNTLDAVLISATVLPVGVIAAGLCARNIASTSTNPTATTTAAAAAPIGQ